MLHLGLIFRTITLTERDTINISHVYNELIWFVSRKGIIVSKRLYCAVTTYAKADDRWFMDRITFQSSSLFVVVVVLQTHLLLLTEIA